MSTGCYTRFVEYVSDLAFPADTGPRLRAEVGRCETYMDTLMAGGGRGIEMPYHGDIYWDIEEASLLALSEDLEGFYDELLEIVQGYLETQGVEYDPAEVAEVVRYQRLRMPVPAPSRMTEWRFAYNLPEYFDRLLGAAPVPVVRETQIMTVRPENFRGDRRRFARETILWGRKSGTMLTEIEWESVGRSGVNSSAPIQTSAGLPPLPRAANLGS